ncbi:class I SAM-dependent methyltransferase [Actinomadura sp. 7K507]|uniref:class I SAM-dependent methyltransferase n=1 Tax=Actinomadura sp. 7K507 TaxID=2530365 RepID=UPI0014055EE7|nr:class I SAM-dependent methyltransferase [Actinomadura sp. 7K507]
MKDDAARSFDAEAELYDLMPSRRNHPDLELYLELAKQHGGPVLEFACGTGRVLIPCVEVAGEGVGVDLSTGMLDQARENASKQGLSENAAQFVQGDMENVRLGRTFPLVLMGGQPLFFLRTDEALRAALETVHVHLAPGGRFATAVPVPRMATMMAERDRLKFVTEIRHPTTGSRQAVWNYSSFDEVTQVAIRRRIVETLDEDGVVTERQHSVQHIHYRHPAEMQRFIIDAGFRFEGLYGDYRRTPFGNGSEYLVWVARKVDDA